jgi:hypothetical protein
MNALDTSPEAAALLEESYRRIGMAGRLTSRPEGRLTVMASHSRNGRH